MTDSPLNQFRSLLFQPTERRKKPKAFCKIKRKDIHVGWGCLVNDAPSKSSNLIKYFIITSSKAIPKENFDAEEYEIEFEKRPSEKRCHLPHIAKTVHYFLSGLVLIAISSECSEFNHSLWKWRKRCSVLRKSPKVHVASQESSSLFFFIGNTCYDSVEDVHSEDSSKGHCSVLFQLNNGDLKVQVVGIVNLEENGQSSTILLPQSSLNTVLAEDESVTQVEIIRGSDDGKVPAEIRARGPWAVNAYNRAIEEGTNRPMRVPIMLIGPAGAGKTSLKKSLTGEKFDVNEKSTNLMEKSPCDVSITNTIWKIGEKLAGKEPDSHSPLTLSSRIAYSIVGKESDNEEKRERQEGQEGQERQDQSFIIPGEEKGEKPFSPKKARQEPESNESQMPVVGNENKEESVDLPTGSETPIITSSALIEEPEERRINTDVHEQSETNVLNEEKIREEAVKCVEWLLQNPEEKNKERLFSVLWDFGGQSVYYVTHPLFLTRKAIYLLVHDLTQNLSKKASPDEKQGRHQVVKDDASSKTNEDILHFWLSSVATSVGQERDQKSSQYRSLPKMIPPVLLVCTHADQYTCSVARKTASKIYDSLKDHNKAYSKHLFKYFTVDNTLAGKHANSECKAIIDLRDVVRDLAKQLLQKAEPIPIKWLKFEEELKMRCKSTPFISLKEARNIAKEKCDIHDEDVFRTALNFLHDQRIVIHFDKSRSSEKLEGDHLDRMVILDLQWLIELFRTVITVKPYDPKEPEEPFDELWKKLEEEAILDAKLLQSVWNQRLGREEPKETAESLISIMEEFSLLCPWPSPGWPESKPQHYLVPYMLRSHPEEDFEKLCTHDCLAPLFVRFFRKPNQNTTTGDESHKNGIQVPMGIFPRLFVNFLKWCHKKDYVPYDTMFQNYVRFLWPSTGYSVILLCRSFVVEILVHGVPDTAYDTLDVKNFCYEVKFQVNNILKKMLDEFFWSQTMQYEICVLCPVCCTLSGRIVNRCCKHGKACKREDCLHLLPLSELQEGLICKRDTFSKDSAIPLKEFKHWLQEGNAVQSTIEDKGPLSSLAGQSASLPRLTAHFVGRDTVVEMIINKLQTYRMVVILSTPGMGKTEVGVRVSYLLKEEGNQFVTHIRVESHHWKLVDVCSEILGRLCGRAWPQTTDFVSLAKRRLSELNIPTVIVLDNTENIQGEEFDEFAAWLVKSAPNVKLIITTQKDVGFVSREVCYFPLRPLDLGSSAELLRSLVDDLSEEHANELAQLCGGIPLLLVTCSDLLNNGLNSKRVIQCLRLNSIQFIKTSAIDVYNTLKVFFTNFPDEVKQILVLFSVFPSEFSAQDIQFLFEDPLHCETVTARMLKHTLLQSDVDGKMRMQPLVQAYIRTEKESLGMSKLWHAAQRKFNHHYLDLLRVLSREFLSKDSALVTIHKFRQQKVNIMEALKNCLEDSSDSDDKNCALDVVNSTEVLDFAARVITTPKELTMLYQKCYDISKVSGDKKKHAESLSSLGFSRLCDVSHSKDSPEETQATFAKFQEAYDMLSTLPEEEQKSQTHAHTVSKLGVCLVLQGDEEKGRKLIQEGISLRKSLSDGLSVASGYVDLGNSYRLCGDHQKAIDIWEKNSLSVYKEQLGEHPWTASILSYIADSYKALAGESSQPGYIDQAEMYFREALGLRKKLLGDQQDTARSRVQLSDVLVLQRQFDKALKELNEAFIIQNDILGPEHKITRNTVSKLIDVMEKLGPNPR